MSGKKKKGKKARQVHLDDSSSDDGIFEETEPPMPKDFPVASEFVRNRDVLYARVDYRKERSQYYVQQWREGKLNIEDLAMNTEHGVNYSKPK